MTLHSVVRSQDSDDSQEGRGIGGWRGPREGIRAAVYMLVSSLGELTELYINDMVIFLYVHYVPPPKKKNQKKTRKEENQ